MLRFGHSAIAAQLLCPSCQICQVSELMDDPPRITLPLFLYGNQPLQRNVAHNTHHVELLKTSPYSEVTLFPSVATSTPINKYFLSDIYGGLVINVRISAAHFLI